MERSVGSDGLIRHDGKVIRCPRNLAKLGFWKSYSRFYGYKKTLLDMGYADSISEAVEAFKILFNIIIFTLLIPIVPFLKCFFDLKRAKKEVKQETKL